MLISKKSKQHKWKILPKFTQLIKGRTLGKCCCLSTALRWAMVLSVTHWKMPSPSDQPGWSKLNKATTVFHPRLKSSTVAALREMSRQQSAFKDQHHVNRLDSPPSKGKEVLCVTGIRLQNTRARGLREQSWGDLRGHFTWSLQKAPGSYWMTLAKSFTSMVVCFSRMGNG